MITASFLKEYGILITFNDLTDDVNDLDEDIFFDLLPALGGDTAIAQVVQIRTEKNKDIIKKYTPEQMQIRNKWLAKFVETQNKSSKEKDQMVVEFFKMFSKKGV